MNRALVVTALLLGACSEPTSPPRTSVYAFDFGGDVFHWPQNRTPVRYFADTRGNMRALVSRAIGAWEQQFLYGEFTGELVADSNVADVIVTWGDSVPPDVTPDTGPAVFACDGVTTLRLDSAGTALEEPIRTILRITNAQAYSAAQFEACVRRTAIHELGHTLGLLQESAVQADIMYSTVQAALPSGRDRQTVQVLYHT
ncbi:MAG: matrixin family metalloprotease, partial [Gemmatimonadales bacterium]